MDFALQFCNKIGSMRKTLTIKQKISTESVDFLDITLYKGQRFLNKRILDLKVYQKPINLYLYIAFDSNEPIHIKRGLIKTELIRYCRISSDELSFQEISSFFFCRLKDRGYPIDFLKKEFKKVKYADRAYYLQKENTTSTKVNQVFFKTIFDSRTQELNLSQLFRDCNGDEFCNNFIENNLQKAPMISYKKDETLGKMLVRAKFQKLPS